MYPESQLKQSASCTASSIVRALDDFLQSVETMRETIMVPSRLKDTNVSVLPVLAPVETPDKSVDHDDYQKQSNKLFIGNTTENADMFAFYRILHAIHQELTVGKSDSDFVVHTNGQTPKHEEDDDEFGNDDTTNALKLVFRHHLHGMYASLRKLTDAANQMSKHYQEQIGSQLLLD